MLKTALIGTVPLTKRMAPYGDPSWDIWVCSPGNSQHQAPPRITKWFELHALCDMLDPMHAGWCVPYFEWLSKQTFPVYMQEHNAHVPNAIQFPRQPLIAKWGESKTRTNWFTSSIAWMMAYALHLGAEEIGIFGVDMAATEEAYSGQKAGCLRFIEIAREMGVRVTIPIESTLATPAPMYGYAEATPMGRASILRSYELKSRIDALRQQHHKTEMEIQFFQGALEQLEWQRRTFVSGLHDAEIDESQFLPEPGHHLTEREVQHAIATGSGDFEQRPSGLVVPSATMRDDSKAPTADDFRNDEAAASLLHADRPKPQPQRQQNKPRPNGPAAKA